jgi:hypothetical protein
LAIALSNRQKQLCVTEAGQPGEPGQPPQQGLALDEVLTNIC